MYKKTTILAFVVCILITTTLAQLSTKSGFCPLKSSITKCSPTCVSDYQCSFNEKCCPNTCGYQSCASPSPVSTGNNYQGSRDGTRVYCGGIKCSTFEKCELDRRSKREKCVRK